MNKDQYNVYNSPTSSISNSTFGNKSSKQMVTGSITSMKSINDKNRNVFPSIDEYSDKHNLREEDIRVKYKNYP